MCRAARRGIRVARVVGVRGGAGRGLRRGDREPGDTGDFGCRRCAARARHRADVGHQASRRPCA
ncbi:hypothetical protein BCEN4_2890002 [Burkholderia cenocepacia]|nr:hypothetical protein BCEN4_2890002 [Burkholderia cenocepacia]